MPTLWVRTGLSPTLTAAVVLHEARHLWQIVTHNESDNEEWDAEEYMWHALRQMGFSKETVAHAIQESLKDGA